MHLHDAYHNGRQMRQKLPTIMTVLENLLKEIGKHNYEQRFAQFLSLLGVAAHFVQILQGDAALRSVLQDIGVMIAGNLEAQTGLKAPRFAKKVHRFIHQRAKETRSDRAHHFFFVYHPDTDWHPEFFHRTETHPLPTNFLGMSSNLDALCVWMLFIRSMLALSKNKKRRSHLHILIPAYRPLIIPDPILFPSELYPLTIEGHIHNSVPQAWLKIPDVPEHGLTLDDVGNLAAPPSFWKRWAGAVTGATLFGTRLAGASATLGLTAAVSTVAAPLIVPVFLVEASAAALGTVTASNAVGETLRIPKPRLLGGNLDRNELESYMSTRLLR